MRQWQSTLQAISSRLLMRCIFNTIMTKYHHLLYILRVRFCWGSIIDRVTNHGCETTLRDGFIHAELDLRFSV